MTVVTRDALLLNIPSLPYTLLMIEAVRRFLDRHRIGPCHLLLACSGGVDSTALLLAAADLRGDGFRITAAHVNHHLRGVESDADETFVRDLCTRLGIELHVADGVLDAGAIRDRGLEAAARDVRQERLAEIREHIGADAIVTAHQRNDQAETVLMRMITGTGLAGLRGIHAVRDDGWIRPLIEVSRSEIEDFLRERGVTARIDRTNADPRFLRNRIRVLLRDLGTAAVDNLAAVAAQASEVWPLFERTIDAVERNGVIATADETRFVRMPDDPFLRQALLHRHIRRLGESREVSAADLRRIASSLGDARRQSITRDVELLHRDGEIVLRRTRERAEQFEVPLRAPGSVYLGAIRSTITLGRREETNPRGSDRMSQMFELPEGADPQFTVRNRRAGDRFQPLGMTRDKKLKDFLIDRKIAAEERDSIPLLVWNSEIVWVAGVAVSERFKVTGQTRPLYEVKLEHGARGDDQDRDQIQR